MWSEELNAEEAFRVGPDSIHGQSGKTGKRGEGFERIFIRHLGPQFLAGAEEDAATRDIHHLAAETDQLHLNAAEERVVDRLVMESVEMKVGVALTVQPGEIVHGECSGDA